MTYIWRLAWCQLKVKAMDVPQIGETSFLITIFLLSGCAACTLICSKMSKCFSFLTQCAFEDKDLVKTSLNVNLTKFIRVTSAQESGWMSFILRFKIFLLTIWEGLCQFVFHLSLYPLLYLIRYKPIVDYFVWGHLLKLTTLSIWKLFNLKEKIDWIIWFLFKEEPPLSTRISLVFLYVCIYCLQIRIWQRIRDPSCGSCSMKW